MKGWKAIATILGLSVAAMGVLRFGHVRAEKIGNDIAGINAALGDTGLKNQVDPNSVVPSALQARTRSFSMQVAPKLRQHFIGRTTTTSISNAMQRWIYLGIVELEQHTNSAVMHVLVGLTGQPPSVSSQYADFHHQYSAHHTARNS